uniref:Uncharacterized protein n=1 Tax=Anopheles darlingi TaxID=43151 RepID=A0A2M4DLS9_ANODA
MRPGHWLRWNLLWMLNSILVPLFWGPVVVRPSGMSIDGIGHRPCTWHTTKKRRKKGFLVLSAVIATSLPAFTPPTSATAKDKTS